MVAKYEGKAAMDNYVMGKDESGKFSPLFFGSDGKKYSYINMERFVEGGYTSEFDRDADFRAGQINFLKGAAFFMFNGDWLEREASDLYDFNEKVAFLRLPVLSEIVLNSKISADFPGGMNEANDQKLSKVIKFIDDFIKDNQDCFDQNGWLNIADKAAAIQEAQLDISVNTLNFITDARRFSHDTMADAAVLQVPVYTKEANEVKEFLKFMYSKQAQDLMMEYAFGLMCPIRVDMNQFDYYTQSPTAFSASKVELWRTGHVISSNMNYSPMNYLGGMLLYVGSSFAYSCFDGKDAETAFQEAYTRSVKSYPDEYEKAFGEEWDNPYE